MAANNGGCTGLGVLANGESKGRNRGLGVWRVFFSGTRTYLKTILKTLKTIFLPEGIVVNSLLEHKMLACRITIGNYTRSIPRFGYLNHNYDVIRFVMMG